MTPTKVVTKQAVLSTISTLFDPLGLLAPITITAKIFVQELWTIRVGWDDPLPLTAATKWNNFINTLKDMPRFTFPRWLGCQSTDQVEIHGFCDASQHAMAASVYIRSINEEGSDYKSNRIQDESGPIEAAHNTTSGTFQRHAVDEANVSYIEDTGRRKCFYIYVDRFFNTLLRGLTIIRLGGRSLFTIEFVIPGVEV